MTGMFSSTRTEGPERPDGLTHDQVDSLIERGYTPHTGLDATGWEPPPVEPTKLVEIIIAVGLVLATLMIVGLIAYWLIR